MAVEEQQPRVNVSGEEIHLSGPFLLSTERPDLEPAARAIQSGSGSVVIKDMGIGEWDSTLMTIVMRFHEEAVRAGRELNLRNLPQGVQRLRDLALAIPPRKGAERKEKRKGMLESIGLHAQTNWKETIGFISFLGEVAQSLGRLVRGKARFRAHDVWLQIESCGPQALGIVSLISVLVGAILAFVGAVQLGMFNAEVYVANLVGLGMVMEMGALMTGIILAGRTGAAFAAQLGTMQVNEEIDALQTLGIPPMDYLVMPRMIALAVMTPLLVIYANTLGILGGATVGILMLDIPAQVFFIKTFEMMTGWLCLQGLIKGCTFGILVAIAGCMRGMNCGRSASAVGQAATSAVVSSLIMIVVADTIWTLVFMI